MSPRTRKKVEVEETEELDELEDLDDLEDEADEVVDEDDEDLEEDEDEDEAPKKRTVKKPKKKPTAKEESGAVGTSELAEALDTDGKNLRVMLRDQGAKKNENNRYEWASIEDAIEALGFEDVEEAKEALAASRNKRLDALKERNADAKKKAKKAPVDEDEDEVDEDEDDEEDEEPAPKKKKPARRSTK
jgi:hypothetical protein